MMKILITLTLSMISLSTLAIGPVMRCDDKKKDQRTEITIQSNLRTKLAFFKNKKNIGYCFFTATTVRDNRKSKAPEVKIKLKKDSCTFRTRNDMKLRDEGYFRVVSGAKMPKLYYFVHKNRHPSECLSSKKNINSLIKAAVNFTAR